jgi:nucleoside-diphosphate-sugar epimerase
MRIVLTGCSGFVGAALAPRLLSAGHELLCVCRPESSAAFGQSISWDSSRPADLSGFPNGADAVVHLAQSRSYRLFPTDSGEMFAVNVAMTMALLQWSAQVGVKHFCLVSSGAVYEPFCGLLKEDATVAPRGFLGATKLASEVLARPFSGLFSLNVLRLFFPYGPGQRNRLIPELVRRVREGRPVQLAGHSDGIRLAPTFIDDVVEVILASFGSSWTGTLNVAAPELLSIRGIANIIGRQLQIEPRFETVSTPAVDIVPDLTLLRSRFSLDRFTKFEDGLRKTLGVEQCVGSS